MFVDYVIGTQNQYTVFSTTKMHISHPNSHSLNCFGFAESSETTVTAKRKKSKPKNASAAAAATAEQQSNQPVGDRRPPELDHHAVQKHLDDWLDNCLKDAPLTSSSSEFLDNHHHHTSGGNGAKRNATAASASLVAAQMYGTSGANGAAAGGKIFGAAGPRPSETPTRHSMNDPFSNYQKVSALPYTRYVFSHTRTQSVFAAVVANVWVGWEGGSERARASGIVCVCE